MNRLVAWGLALASVAVAVVPKTAEARRASRTLHVEVHETNGDRVSVAVPVGLARMALRLAGRVEVELDDRDVAVTDLREAWEALRASGERAVVDVKDGEETVRIRNEKGRVTVNVAGGARESVHIEVPETAVDALLSGDGDALDLAAALDALEDTFTGDLVNVVDGDDRVRIWID